jgi:hypothetical protein
MRAAPALISVAVLVGLAAALHLGAQQNNAQPPAPATGASPDPRPPVVERVVDSDAGLRPGWMDFGYSPHTIKPGGPVEIDFANYGGFILAKQGPLGPFGGLSFRYRAPDSFGDFLEVQLQSMLGDAVTRTPVTRNRAVKLADGSLEVWLSMQELNPEGKPFQRMMFFGRLPVGHDLVLLDQVAFTAPPPPTLEPPRAATFALDCSAAGHPISPLIYGVAGADPSLWTTGATARRWGGNPVTRYNWELNTTNRSNDWFFLNSGDPKSSDYEQFIDENRRHGLKAALTVPTIGWVAKDATSYSFPVSVFGRQQATAPNMPDMGNGVAADGKPLQPGPATRTSVPSTPESIERWVRTIREKDRTRGRSIDAYILDNEPMLWNSTHRDVHPEPTTYDELLEKTLAYAAAIRRADPEATIAGPAEWGWLAYQYSAKDAAAGVSLRPDRRLHGDVPLIPWYLRKIREHEQQTGTRLLDILDVHFYPMGQGVYQGGTDPATAALRIRSTRSLWDPTYVDESWINERMRVLPLLREWIDANHPGIGISIGEWNFGAETHMSGGLATAEVLGRFGTEGVTSAYYWVSPADKSPAFWAFRAFRNFDGAGGHFLDWFVPVKTDGTLTSLFASRDAARGHIVALLLNLAPRTPLAPRVSLQGCGTAVTSRAFTYTGGDGFKTLDLTTRGTTIEAAVAPYSMTVVDVTLAPPAR